MCASRHIGLSVVMIVILFVLVSGTFSILKTKTVPPYYKELSVFPEIVNPYSMGKVRFSFSPTQDISYNLSVSPDTTPLPPVTNLSVVDVAEHDGYVHLAYLHHVGESLSVGYRVMNATTMAFVEDERTLMSVSGYYMPQSISVEIINGVPYIAVAITSTAPIIKIYLINTDTGGVYTLLTSSVYALQVDVAVVPAGDDVGVVYSIYSTPQSYPVFLHVRDGSVISQQQLTFLPMSPALDAEYYDGYYYFLVGEQPAGDVYLYKTADLSSATSEYITSTGSMTRVALDVVNDSIRYVAVSISTADVYMYNNTGWISLGSMPAFSSFYPVGDYVERFVMNDNGDLAYKDIYSLVSSNIVFRKNGTQVEYGNTTILWNLTIPGYASIYPGKFKVQLSSNISGSEEASFYVKYGSPGLLTDQIIAKKFSRSSDLHLSLKYGADVSATMIVEGNEFYSANSTLPFMIDNPQLVFSDSAFLYISFVGGNYLYLSKSNDLGWHWETPVRVLEMKEYLVYYGIDVSPDGRTIVIGYSKDNMPFISYSLDGGRTWDYMIMNVSCRYVYAVGYNTLDNITIVYDDTATIHVVSVSLVESSYSYILNFSSGSNPVGITLLKEKLFVSNSSGTYVMAFNGTGFKITDLYGMLWVGEFSNGTVALGIYYLSTTVYHTNDVFSPDGYRVVSILQNPMLGAAYERSLVLIGISNTRTLLVRSNIFAISVAPTFASEHMLSIRGILYNNKLPSDNYTVTIKAYAEYGSGLTVSDWIYLDNDPPSTPLLHVIGGLVGWSHDVNITLSLNEACSFAEIYIIHGDKKEVYNMTRINDTFFYYIISRSPEARECEFYIVVWDLAGNKLVVNNEGLNYKVTYIPMMPEIYLSPAEYAIIALISAIVGIVSGIVHRKIASSSQKKSIVKKIYVFMLIAYIGATVASLAVLPGNADIALGLSGLAMLFSILFLLMWVGNTINTTFARLSFSPIQIVLVMVHLAVVVIAISTMLVIGMFVEWFRYYILLDLLTVGSVGIPKVFISLYGVVFSSLILMVVSTIREVKERIREIKMISSSGADSTTVQNLTRKHLSRINRKMSYKILVFLVVFGASLIMTTKLTRYAMLGATMIGPLALAFIAVAYLPSMISRFRKKKPIQTERKISADSVICPHCGQFVPASSIYCPFCGKNIKKKKEYLLVKCPSCGRETAAAKYCMHCGAPISS